jgi:hypothetical protein
MDTTETRVECLRMAANLNPSMALLKTADQVRKDAEEFYDFVLNGRREKGNG